jgi:hypothetical protein
MGPQHHDVISANVAYASVLLELQQARHARIVVLLLALTRGRSLVWLAPCWNPHMLCKCNAWVNRTPHQCTRCLSSHCVGAFV